MIEGRNAMARKKWTKELEIRKLVRIVGLQKVNVGPMTGGEDIEEGIPGAVNLTPK
jgi:hypothetical protein